jgi:hypothetical protein
MDITSVRVGQSSKYWIETKNPLVDDYTQVLVVQVGTGVPVAQFVGPMAKLNAHLFANALAKKDKKYSGSASDVSEKRNV